MLHEEERKENRTAGALFLLVMVWLEGQAIKLLYLYLLLPSQDTHTQNPQLSTTKLKYLQPLEDPYYQCNS
jgi:hypothetical protein